MEQKLLKILSHQDFEERAKLFYEKYDLKDIIVTGDHKYSKKSLTKSSEKTCLFCQRVYGKSGFSNLAHLVPKFMGNSNLYSDFECNKCNDFFSSLENDLANFLGISRSILGINNEKIAPGFVARKLSAKSRSYVGDNILIIAPEDIEKDGATTKIKYIKNPFVPSKVYKALLKSSLSILGNKEVTKNYKLAIAYLMGNLQVMKGAFVSGYNLSFQLNFPFHIYLFEKKVKADKIPTHILSFHFQNNIISLPVPLHREDIDFYNIPYEVPICPPYFTSPRDIQIAFPLPYNRDFSGKEKILNEEEIISFNIEPNSVEKISVYDSVTDKFLQKPYKMAQTKYLIIMREGMTIDPKKFSEFIKNIT